MPKKGGSGNNAALKAIDATGGKSGGKGGETKGGGEGKPCKYFLTPKGCKFGAKRKDLPAAERFKRCLNCGSEEHRVKDCKAGKAEPKHWSRSRQSKQPPPPHHPPRHPLSRPRLFYPEPSEPPFIGHALLDSGATHPMRQASSEEEWEVAEEAQVRLAGGQSTFMRLTRAGTLLLPPASGKVVRLRVRNGCPEVMERRLDHDFQVGGAQTATGG